MSTNPHAPPDPGKRPDPFPSELFQALQDSGASPKTIYRKALEEGSKRLVERFQAEEPVVELVTDRASLVDELLVKAWYEHFPDDPDDIALVAVGGYGRGELHPGSDIDLMILLRDALTEDYQAPIESFVTFLWDIGLEVGHSVRSLDECVREATQDITVMTNLLEARLIAGAHLIFESMRERTGPEHIWSSKAFFEAKVREQRARHRKLHNTAYKLEPNIKENPGGLRDIQMVGWVAKRHFGTDTMRSFISHNFLTESEYNTLMAGQIFLWKVRFALHVLAGRREDRLLFDHQRTLAQQFGYRDSEQALAVEQFMQDYYRTVMELERLNEMLLQLFEEAILHTTPINRRFQAVNGFLEVTSADIFRRYPLALLEIFLILAQQPKLKGVRASTIRLVRGHRHLIDDKFRRSLGARSLFMEILRQPRGLTHELRRMNRYGVLAAYLPAFARIVGRMQYDLFHVYTVDEHILFTVRNLRRMSIAEYAHELPLCSKRFQKIPKPELLYLAALFHDIAKGQGGDHSELGAGEAEAFCLHHGLNRYDSRLVGWLVRNHLLMSMTAQRKDISDPQIIHEFAAHVATQQRLDYLYLLTVADIRATNPALWNSWKDALLKELYFATQKALRRGLENPLDKQQQIEAVKEESHELLRQAGIAEEAIGEVWREFSDDYFLRYSAEEITWHTQAIARTSPSALPVVLVRHQPERGGTEVFVYAKNHLGLFVQTASVLDQLGLTVLDARISTSKKDDFTLDSYSVLEASGEPIRDPSREQEIRLSLHQHLSNPHAGPVRVSRRIPRQHKHFPIPTQIDFMQDLRNRRTIMELSTADRPGLLSLVGRAFTECQVQVHTAKITTFGTRVEDVFFLTNANGEPLNSEEKRLCLQQCLLKHLEGDQPAT